MTVIRTASLGELDNDRIMAMRDAAATSFERRVGQGLRIDMARGKPGPEQLDESSPLLELPGRGDYIAEDGTDCRTYGGGVLGLPEARRLLAPLTGVPPDQVIVSGNSSLTLMHNALGHAFAHGTPDSERPWYTEPVVKFICPVPGYDCHFTLLADHGVEMVSVPLTGDGPDLSLVESLVASDPSIKGLIGVPRFSNPTGETYSAECVTRLARMQTAAPDFRLLMDNAYAVHHLGGGPVVPLANVVAACDRAGHPNRAIVFSSTSKITLPRAGVAIMGSSPANIKWFADHARKCSISPDKINQLRHVRFLQSWDGVLRLMERHAKHLAPKFDAVDSVFKKVLGCDNIKFASWWRPPGGYFISLYTPRGCASAIIRHAAEAGVTMTPAGAAYPHGVDQEDHHIRIAPTCLSPEQAEIAADVVSWTLRLVACNSELVRRGLSNKL